MRLKLKSEKSGLNCSICQPVANRIYGTNCKAGPGLDMKYRDECTDTTDKTLPHRDEVEAQVCNAGALGRGHWRIRGAVANPGSIEPEEEE